MTRRRRTSPVPQGAKGSRYQVPHVWRDPSAALDPIDDIIKGLIDFRKDSGTTSGEAAPRRSSSSESGKPSRPRSSGSSVDHGNAVLARWVFQTAVRRQFPLALEVTRSRRRRSSTPGSSWGAPPTSTSARRRARSSRRYLEHVVLKQRLHNPYVVGRGHGRPDDGRDLHQLPPRVVQRAQQDAGAALRPGAGQARRDLVPQSAAQRLRHPTAVTGSEQRPSTRTSWRGRGRTSLRWTPKASTSSKASWAASSSPSSRTPRRRPGS